VVCPPASVQEPLQLSSSDRHTLEDHCWIATILRTGVFAANAEKELQAA